MSNGFTLVREIAASPERVWSAFTDAGEYAAWIWPADWKTECEIEPRVGGAFRVASEPRGLEVNGTYTVVDPFTDLELTWRWRDATEASRVRITLEPIESGTRLTLAHDQFESVEAEENHRIGWSDCLDRLPAWVAAQSS